MRRLLGDVFVQQLLLFNAQTPRPAGFQQVGTLLPGPSQRLFPTPAANQLVIAAQQYRRYCLPVVHLRAGVVGAIEQVFEFTGKRILLGGILVSQHSG